MAELEEGLKYGLASLPTQRPTSLLHVKLTDSALRAIDEFHKKIKENTSRRPSIQFKNNTGIINVPVLKTADNQHGYRTYKFALAPIQGDPKGSFDCIKQTTDRAHVSTLQAKGTLTHKLQVSATDDVYQDTKQKVAAAEEQSKKQWAKEVKIGGTGIGRRVRKVLKPGTVEPPRRTSPLSHHSMNSTLPSMPATSQVPPRHNNPPPQRGSSGHSSHQRAAATPAASSSHQLSSVSSKHPSSRTSSPAHPRTSPGHHGTSRAPAQPKTSPSHGVSSRAPTHSRTASPMQHDISQHHKTHPPPVAAPKRPSPNPHIINLPYRDRIIHLLAIRSYKKPELTARLMKDGIRDKDKSSLSSTLNQVAVWNGKENSFSLKKHLYSDVKMNWPGYTEADRQLLKRTLPDDHGSTQGISPTYSNCSQGSPNNSQKRPTSTTDDDHGALYKKQRLAHKPSSKTHSSHSKHSNSNHTERREASPKVTSPVTTDADMLSILPDKARDVVKQEVTTTTPDTPQHNLTYDKPVKEEDKLKTIDMNGNRSNMTTKELASSTSETPDYVVNYTTIQTHAQRKIYKSDFDREYDEYKITHSSIEKVTKRFQDLHQELLSKEEGTDGFQCVKKAILREYRNYKKDPKYIAHRQRNTYLHQKLGHIKRLVNEYDQNQLLMSS